MGGFFSFWGHILGIRVVFCDVVFYDLSVTGSIRARRIAILVVLWPLTFPDGMHQMYIGGWGRIIRLHMRSPLVGIFLVYSPRGFYFWLAETLPELETHALPIFGISNFMLID